MDERFYVKIMDMAIEAIYRLLETLLIWGSGRH